MYSLLKIYLFVYLFLFLVLLGLLCCVCGFSPFAVSRVHSLVAVCWSLIVVASPLVEHRLQGTEAPEVPARGLSDNAYGL